jgi:glycosyltransferase involved in cell wall biosynthesis
MSHAGKILRVGFDARWHNDSGVGTYVAELLRAMAKSESLELVIYEDPANRVPGLDGSGIEKVLVRNGRYSAASQVDLARRSRKDGLDVFHSPFYMTPFAAKCPVVVTIHDLIPFLFPVYSRMKSALVKAGYRMAAHKSAHVISVSDSTAADLRKIMGVGCERVTVVHNAAGELFRPSSDASEMAELKQKYGIAQPYVVAASARNWQTKNLEGALRTLEVAQELSGVQIQAVVYGPEEGFRAAGGRGRWSGLDLRTTGQVSSGELAMLFRNAAAFIMPSLYEGFGLPLVEAMACGCAVVTSKRGSLAEIAGGGAQIFEPSDVAGMGAAIAKLLTDEAESQKWKAAALKRSAEFSWQKAARETISVYHRAYREWTERK